MFEGVVVWRVRAVVRLVMCVVGDVTKKSGIRGGGSFNRTPFWTMGSSREFVASCLVVCLDQG